MQVMREESRMGGGKKVVVARCFRGSLPHGGHSHGVVGKGVRLSLPFSRFSLLS